MLEKLTRSLTEDIAPLLPAGVRFNDDDAMRAFERVWKELIARVRGDAWKLTVFEQHQFDRPGPRYQRAGVRVGRAFPVDSAGYLAESGYSPVTQPNGSPKPLARSISR